MKKIIFIFVCLMFQGVCLAQWNTDRIMSIGRNALYFEDYVLSIQYFNQVINVKPHLAEPYMYRAMAKIQLGDYLGAEADCTEAISRNPFIPQAFYARGFSRSKLGNYEAAIDDFTKTFQFSPNSWFLLLSRMDTKERLQDYQGALTDLDEYMRLNPKMTALNYDKGRLQLALKDTVAAEQTFNKYVEADPKNSLPWSARGLLYLQKNDLDKALADYNQAIELKSNFSGDYINRGIINVQKNNFRQALADYDRAIKLDRNSTLAYYNRGLLRSNLGDINNALDDLRMVVGQDSTYMEARYKKAALEFEVGNFKEALADYKAIIKRHPEFLPAYAGVAQVEKRRGNKLESQRYYQMVVDLEQKQRNRKKDDEELVADNKIADQTQKSASSKRTELFNRFAAQNMDMAEKESKYANDFRGAVQDKHTDLVSERNFVLTYYSKSDELRNSNFYHQTVDLYNRGRKSGAALKITNNEIPLTEELIKTHFEAIDNISQRLAIEEDAETYFNRAIEFALVQDFANAIKDLNRAIFLRPDFTLAYFCRANIRHKQIEYINNSADEALTEERIDKLSHEKQYAIDAEFIMRDYEKVISLSPDFQFAYFNRANILASLQDFGGAISGYSKALEIDPTFAEAYYNRGLIYLFTGEDNKGITDLSKAGELGVYKVYNLIQRFNK